MENNILLLAEKDLHQLTQLNLQPYDDILLLTASPDHSVPISTIRQLLGLQQQFQRQINLLTSSVSKPNVSLGMATRKNFGALSGKKHHYFE